MNTAMSPSRLHIKVLGHRGYLQSINQSWPWHGRQRNPETKFGVATLMLWSRHRCSWVWPRAQNMSETGACAELTVIRTAGVEEARTPLRRRETIEVRFLSTSAVDWPSQQCSPRGGRILLLSADATLSQLQVRHVYARYPTFKSSWRYQWSCFRHCYYDLFVTKVNQRCVVIH